jgi:hypothetical protein
VLFALGCSGGSGPEGDSPDIACLFVGLDGGFAIPSNSLCSEYFGDWIPIDCSPAAGGAEVDECPVPDRLGRCEILVAGGGGSFEHVYTYPPLTLADARMACDRRSGTFTEL